MIIKKALPVGAVLGAGFLTFSNVSADSMESQALDNAKALQQYYQDLYDNAKNAKPVAEANALSNAQKSYNDNVSALNTIPRTANTPYTNKISVSPMWITYYKKYLAATSLSEKNSAKNILSDIANDEADNNVFKGDGLDTKTQYNPRNLPPAMMNKLNAYFVDLINSFHAQMGTNKTAYYNTTVMSFAEAVAQGYESSNFVAASNGHNLEAINNAASRYGLNSNSWMNQYENLTTAFVTSKQSQTFTEAQLYKMVYDSTLNFTIYDVYSDFGHIKSLLSSTTMGLAFSNVVDEMGWHNVQLHVESVTSPNLLTNPASYESMYGIGSPNTVRPNQKQADVQMAYDSSVVALSSASASYSSASAALSYSASKALVSLNSANKQLSSAQAAYDKSLANSNNGSSGDDDGTLDVPIVARLEIKAHIWIEND